MKKGDILNDDIKLMKRVKSGVLDIRGKGIVKKYAWKPRYFILTEKGSIVYYSIDIGKKEKCFKGYISLKQCKINILDKKKFCFVLIDKGKEYVLRCRSYEDLKEWVKVIRNAMMTIVTQRQTNFQSFKPIPIQLGEIRNRERNDSIEDFINENLMEDCDHTVDDGFENLGVDGTIQCVNPYFLDDDVDTPEYMKALKKDIPIRDDMDLYTILESDLDVLKTVDTHDEDIKLFEIVLSISTDIVEIVEDLNVENSSVVQRTDSTDRSFDGKDKGGRRKRKPSLKKSRRRKVWSGEHIRYTAY